MATPEWLSKLPLTAIQYAAKRYGLSWELVASIAWQESRGIPWVTRYEAHTDKYVLTHREYASRLMISQETERLAQMHSYGLLQIMGFCARELGFDDYLIKLCQPEIGLEFACRKLLRIAQRKTTEEEADIISSWNQGGPYRAESGMYKNQKYVDAVNKNLLELRAY